MSNNVQYTHKSRKINPILSPAFVYYASKSGVIDFFKELNPNDRKFPSEVGKGVGDDSLTKTNLPNESSEIEIGWDCTLLPDITSSPLLQQAQLSQIEKSFSNGGLNMLSRFINTSLDASSGSKRKSDALVASTSKQRQVTPRSNVRIQETHFHDPSVRKDAYVPSLDNIHSLSSLRLTQTSAKSAMVNTASDRMQSLPNIHTPNHMIAPNALSNGATPYQANDTVQSVASRLPPRVADSNLAERFDTSTSPIFDLTNDSGTRQQAPSQNLPKPQSQLASFFRPDVSKAKQTSPPSESTLKPISSTAQTRQFLQALKVGQENALAAKPSFTKQLEYEDRPDCPKFLKPKCSGFSATQWVQESLGGTHFLSARTLSAATVLQSHPTPGIGIGPALRAWISHKAPHLTSRESTFAKNKGMAIIPTTPLLPFAEMQADASLFSTASLLKACSSPLGDWSYLSNVQNILPLFLLPVQHNKYRSEQYIFGSPEPLPSESNDHYVASMTWTIVGGQSHPDDVIGAAFLLRFRNSALQAYIDHLEEIIRRRMEKGIAHPPSNSIDDLFRGDNYIPCWQDGNGPLLTRDALQSRFLPLLRPCIHPGYSTCIVYLPLVSDPALEFLQLARSGQNGQGNSKDMMLLPQEERWKLLNNVLSIRGIPKLCLNAKGLCYSLLRSPVFHQPSDLMHMPNDLCDVLTATWLLSPDSVAMFKSFTPATPIGWHPLGDPEHTVLYPSPVTNWTDNLPTPLYQVPEPTVTYTLKNQTKANPSHRTSSEPLAYPTTTSYASESIKQSALIGMKSAMTRTPDPERPSCTPSVVQKIYGDPVLLLENMAREYNSVIETVSYYIENIYSSASSDSSRTQKQSSTAPPECITHLYLLQYYGDIVLAGLFIRGMHVSYFAQEAPLVIPLIEMETQGVGLDVGILSTMEQQVQTMLVPIMEEIKKYAGPIYGPDLNINSPKQISFLLYEHLKIAPITKQTNIYNKNQPVKGGRNLSTDTATLTLLADQHPVCALIVEYRRLSKMDQSFISSLKKIAVSKVGNGLLQISKPKSDSTSSDSMEMQIHPQLHAIRTGTGRLSCSHPNLQTLPSNVATVEVGEESMDGKAIRKSILPASRGHVLVSADYSQIEVRLIASLAGESRLIEEFVDFSNANKRMRNRARLLKRKNNPSSQLETQTTQFDVSQSDVDADKTEMARYDIYNRVGGNVFSCPPVQVSPQQRQMAKVFLLGLQYGMGVNEAARKVNLSRQETQKHLQSLQKAYPRLHRFLHFAAGFAAKYCHVITATGRRRLLPESRHTDPARSTYATRQAVNTIIQGTAADIMKQALILIQEGINKSRNPRYVSPYDSADAEVKELSRNANHCPHYHSESYNFRLDTPIPRIPANMMLQVHDEVVLECSQEPHIIDEVCAGVEYIMSILAPQRVEKIWQHTSSPLTGKYLSFVSNRDQSYHQASTITMQQQYDIDRMKLLGEVQKFQVPFDVTIEVGPTFGNLEIWTGK